MKGDFFSRAPKRYPLIQKTLRQVLLGPASRRTIQGWVKKSASQTPVPSEPNPATHLSSCASAVCHIIAERLTDPSVAQHLSDTSASKGGLERYIQAVLGRTDDQMIETLPRGDLYKAFSETDKAWQSLELAKSSEVALLWSFGLIERFLGQQNPTFKTTGRDLFAAAYVLALKFVLDDPLMLCAIVDMNEKKLRHLEAKVFLALNSNASLSADITTLAQQILDKTRPTGLVVA